MGIAISGWPLARAVSSAGQLGVVSGTAIDNVFVRRLQDNGIDDELQMALDLFPAQRVVEDIVAKYGSVRRTGATPYRSLPALTQRSAGRSIDAIVLASFVEVTLAKMGHDGVVGINLLTKVQLPTRRHTVRGDPRRRRLRLDGGRRPHAHPRRPRTAHAWRSRWTSPSA